jgi:hypothetical protein
MDQQALFHEDVYEALRTDIMACGGMKQVGAALYPEKLVDKASELLNNCLNITRPEKLSPEQVLFIKRLAKQHGSFAVVMFECDEIGLTHPAPIEPEDQKAILQREFIAAIDKLDRLKSQMGRLA